MFGIELSGLMLLASMGFVLGIRHSIDPDHIMAVSNIVASHKSLKKAGVTGMFWGIGHMIVLSGTGLLVLLSGIAFPEPLLLLAEVAVGLMLVCLGIRTVRSRLHLHTHSHGGRVHIHVHSHMAGKSHGHSHKPMAIGALHGFSGSAALALLVLANVNNLAQGLMFLIIFGLGSIAGMSVFSMLLGMPLKLSNERIGEGAKGVIGFASIMLGIIIIVNNAVLL